MDYKFLDEIIRCMATSDKMYDIQKIQTIHRIKLAEFWGIKDGMKILEIGCGQGDTTAVLAYFVGENGLVNGIDIAPEDYGSPITVGASAEYLKKSKLGKQIKIDFKIDILSEDIDFPEKSFDIIVLSHCSWYLKSFDELQKILKKARSWGKQLCFAEWDTRINTIEEYPHFLAALIQAQYECFKPNSLSNIRTLFTPMDIKSIAEKSGWSITEEQTISSENLQDGKWEIDMVINQYKSEINKISNIPEKYKELIKSEVDLLNEYVKENKFKSLSTYAFVGF